MNIGQKEAVGLVYEYLFARAVETYNQNVDDVSKVITASQGKALHAKWLAEMKRRQGAKGKFPGTIAMEEAMNAVFRPRTGEDVFPLSGGEDDSNGRNNPTYLKWAGEFVKLSPTIKQEDGSYEFRNGSLIPLSPYMDEVKDRKALRTFGTEVLYVSSDEMDDLGISDFSDMFSMDGQDISVWRKSAEDKPPYRLKDMHLFEPEDMSGLSLLMPYMTPDEFEVVNRNMQRYCDQTVEQIEYKLNDRMKRAQGKELDEWRARVAKKNDKKPEEVRVPAKYASPVTPNEFEEMKRAGIERYHNNWVHQAEIAASVMKYATDHGYTYTVEADRNSGQVLMKMNSDASIRIMDLKTPSHAVNGYVHGNSMYYDMTGTDKRPYNMPVRVTEQDAINMFRMVMNEPVEQNILLTDEARGTVQVGAPWKYRIRKHSGYGSWFSDTTDPNEKVTFNRIYDEYRPEENGAKPSLHRGNMTRQEYLENQVRIAIPDGGGRPVSAKTAEIAEKNVEYLRKTVCLEADRVDPTIARQMRYRDPEEAENYLRTAIASARDQYRLALDVDGILKAYRNKQEYSFSSNEQIAGIQQGYWMLLNGEWDTLVRPGDAEKTREAMLNGDLDENPADMASWQYPQGMSAEEMIRQHAEDSVEADIGTYEIGANGKRFNPKNVALYMISTQSPSDSFETLVVSARTKHLHEEEMMKAGDTSDRTFAQGLISFDENSAQSMSAMDNPYAKQILKDVTESLAGCGLFMDLEKQPDAVQIDENGIIRYTARYMIGKDSGVLRTVQGEIGQIFIPDEKGRIYTKFNGPDNYMMVPGYRAHILPQDEGTIKSVAERTRLSGYMQEMQKKIRSTIQSDALCILQQSKENGDIVEKSARREAIQIGQPCSVNKIYGKLYAERHPVNFLEVCEQYGLERSVAEAILDTEACRVRYDSEINDDTSRFSNTARKAANDNFRSDVVGVGARDMMVLTEEDDGYYDPSATSQGKTQGLVRYLTESARVAPDGSIIPGDKDDQTPLMKHEAMRYASFDAADRKIMAFSNLMSAIALTKPVGAAQILLNGWTQDDGFVISKRFAEEHMVPDENDNPRPLRIGDKISDLHGNKGCIPLVVDPDMSAEEASKAGVDLQIVKLFRENPDLQVVMPPFSAVSRQNGGTAKELMEHPSDLKLPNGETGKNAMGTIQIVIQDKMVDKKSHIYDQDALAEGKGRASSAQLGWSLDAMEADAIKQEIYGRNTRPFQDFKEYMIAIGMDVNDVGDVQAKYTEDTMHNRKIFKLPEEPILSGDDVEKHLQTLMEEMATSGGFLEVPFPLNFTGDPRNVDPKTGSPVGVQIPYLNKERNGVTYDESESCGSYALPIMSAGLRQNQIMQNGFLGTQAYTSMYQTIARNALRYQQQDLISKNTEISKDAAKAAESAKRKRRMAAQTMLGKLENYVVTHNFDRPNGKNMFRYEMMRRHLPDSATAVWTANPMLDIDQIGIGPAIAEALHLKDDDYAMVWRDPMLRPEGDKYMRVKILDNLTGASINPNMDKCFDGDFDGDSVAIVKLHTPPAKKEAMEKFSVEANLLDTGCYEDEEETKHPLAMQHGLDVSVVEHYQPKYKKFYAALTDAVNSVETKFKNGLIDKKTLDLNRKVAKKRISDLYRDVYAKSTGMIYLQYGSMKEHMQSIVHACLDTGAKGNPKQVMNYATYIGCKLGLKEGTEDELDIENMEEFEHTLATRAMLEGSMKASAIKANGTGVAGAFAQRAMRALRNQCPRAVLELTYPVTQSILQAKHDPDDAQRRFDLLVGPVRDLWRGYRLDENWQPVKDKNGKFQQATPEEWKEQFREIYMSKNGLDVKINGEYLNELADAITKDGVICNMDTDMEGALMDQLAYCSYLNIDGTKYKSWALLVDAAEKGTNIYEGERNATFMPNLVRENQDAIRMKELDPDGSQRERLREMDADFSQMMGKQYGISEKDLEEREVRSTAKRDTRADTMEELNTAKETVGADETSKPKKGGSDNPNFG